MQVSLFGQTGEEREDDVSYQKTQNWIPYYYPNGKSKIVLYPTPGLTEFSDFTSVNNNAARGSIEYGGGLYVVVGNKFYEVTQSGSFLERGPLETSSGHVSMAHNGSNNGKQIIVVDGLRGYIYDSSAETFTKIASNFPEGATFAVFMDSYFIVNDPDNSGRFYISSSYDGTTWGALDFATAERSPDELKSIAVTNKTLWFLGGDTVEAWFNGGEAFPFEPDQSGYIEWGIDAPFSTEVISGNLFWLANNSEGSRLIVRANGSQVSVISEAINNELVNLTTTSDAYSWSYQHDGHAFYVISFPTDGRTFVYDLSTEMWHEWSSKTIGYHRSISHTYVYGKHIVGDPVQGKLYYLDWDKYTDNGDTITRIRRSANIHAEDKAVRHLAVHIDLKEGVGNDDEEDPQIMLRFRDDNGGWKSESWRSMGKIGENNIRAIWRRLGRSRDRVYEIKVTDPVNAVLIGSYVNIKMDVSPLR